MSLFAFYTMKNYISHFIYCYQTNSAKLPQMSVLYLWHEYIFSSFFFSFPSYFHLCHVVHEKITKSAIVIQHCNRRREVEGKDLREGRKEIRRRTKKTLSIQCVFLLTLLFTKLLTTFFFSFLFLMTHRGNIVNWWENFRLYTDAAAAIEEAIEKIFLL